MNKKLFYYITGGFFFVVILGTLFHFIYEWSGEKFLAGLIAPVSESTWEHMKMLFFPMLLYGIFASFRLKKEFPCIISGMCTGILLGTFLIPVLFYTYTGVLGTNVMALDVLTFIVSALAAFNISYKLTLRCRLGGYTRLLETAVFLLLLSFLLFSCYPPGIGLFREP